MEAPVLPGEQALVSGAEALPRGAVLVNAELRQTDVWEQGIDLGLWDPKTQAMLLPMRSRSGAEPFEPQERLEQGSSKAETREDGLEIISSGITFSD